MFVMLNEKQNKILKDFASELSVFSDSVSEEISKGVSLSIVYNYAYKLKQFEAKLLTIPASE